MTAGEPKHGIIQKNYSDAPALDYNFLRRQAVELIQKFSGQNWTDFNIHDPGITILELLCYAITDLAYRTGFPITDLLANEQGIVSKRSHSFVPGNRILSSSPVSVNDFRKLLIDEVEEISNAWLEPVLSKFSSGFSKGAYRVILQVDGWRQQEADNEEKKKKLEETVIRNVKTVLADYRNIGEDFIEFIVLQPQKIEVNAQLVISKSANPEELLAEVYFRIRQALNPKISFFAEQQLLSQGNAIEDIYKGPLLKQGIIPDSELKDVPSEVDKANIIKPVSDIKDVIHIRHFQLKSEEEKEYADKPIRLKKYHYPFLSFNPDLPGVALYYSNLPVPVNTPVFYRMLQRLHDVFRKDFIRNVHDANTHKNEEGAYRNVQEYISLQNLFPAIYRIGSEGIEDTASPLRKSQAKQLKAYLLFFEQILAGYAAQLGNLDSLFSTDIQSASAHTYFFQPLYNVPHVAPLLSAFTEQQNLLWEAFKGDKENNYIKGLSRLTESDEVYRTRKKKVFDHLLSRFNIVPDNYPVAIYKQLYNPGDEEGRMDEELEWKSVLLSQVQPFTYYRVRAENYYLQNHEEERHGFYHNMRLLLYIRNNEKRLTDAVTAHVKNSRKKAVSSGISARREVRKIIHNNEELLVIKEEEEQDLSSFYFPHRSAKFFEWGTNRNNYRIVPSGHQPEQFVVYKNPAERYWHIVRRFADRQSAQEGISEVIKSLVDVSIKSEGFHVVEHLLLAPPRTSKVFGFTLYDKHGKPLLQQAHWMSFDEREKAIQDMIDVTASAHQNRPDEWLEEIKRVCKIAAGNDADNPEYIQPDTWYDLQEHGLSQILLRIQKNLRLLDAKTTGYYPEFRYTVLHWDGSVMEETFYDNRVTIVLPAWPLRFQHEGFRQFAENAFQNHLPLHTNVGFLWLGISKMVQFETMFYNWKEALQSDNEGARRMESILLIPFLRNELKQKTS